MVKNRILIHEPDPNVGLFFAYERGCMRALLARKIPRRE
jgi:hypothetical protein